MRHENRVKLEWMRAVTCGCLPYSEYNHSMGCFQDKPFTELKYFFNEKGDEVGQLFLEGTKWERLVIFEKHRKWHSSLKAKLINME